MNQPRARHIPELLQIHADELAFVWGQRRAALHSAEQTQRDFADLTERVEAHTQGLLCAPPGALLELLSPGLAADPADADQSFASAHGLLRAGAPAGQQAVIAAFARAHGPTLQGLREALCLAAPAPVAGEMQSALDHAPPATAAAAAAVLAAHQLLPAASPRLARLLEDPDGPTAALAWRAALLADRRARDAAPTRPFAQAVAHDDDSVRDAAWAAVAWAGHRASRSTLRQRASAGDAVALRWLAVLGEAEDVGAVQSGVLGLADGARRCALLARHGHPAGLNALLRWMQEPNEATAVAAGEAFEIITGVDVRGPRRPLTPPDGADDFEREMAPLAWFPDPAKARAALECQSPAWAAGVRWRRGLCVDPEPDADAAVRALDMQARWDMAARAALGGGAVPPPPLA